MKSKNKVHSIYTEIVGLFVLTLTLTIASVAIVNACFLSVFYINEKCDVMVENFNLINEYAADGILESSDLSLELEKLHANYNLTVVIMNSSGEVIASNIPDTQEMFNQFWSALLEQQNMDVDSNYILLRQQDKRLGEEYIVLCGTLDDGNLIIIRTAIESINESIGLANRFLIYVGGLALILSVCIVFFFTRRITEPISELTEISRKMSNMDFSVKYKSSKKRNEIDVLGEYMNELSEALEENILELKQANHELEKDLALREESQAAQQAFVSNVSHELKTPIAVIQGYAEALCDGISDNPEDIEFYCNVIIDEAKRMNNMVLSLINLNQLETGGSDVTYTHYDITEQIQNMLLPMNVLFEQNEIRVSFDDSKKRLVYADDSLVEQVLNNYLSNAIHYAAGEKKIIIRFKEFDHKLRVCVFNTGNQIPEESIDQIWDKFYKVDKARTREYGGTGIGLSIVKAVMESLHQDYGVTNYDDGVEFWFELEC